MTYYAIRHKETKAWAQITGFTYSPGWQLFHSAIPDLYSTKEEIKELMPDIDGVYYEIIEIEITVKETT